MSHPCTTPGCVGRITRGVGTRCSACYARKSRYGTYDPAVQAARRAPRPCANPGCGTIIPIRRWCARCAAYKQRHGHYPDLVPAARAPLAPDPAPWQPPAWWCEEAQPDTGWGWELRSALEQLRFVRCEGDRNCTEEERAA